MMFRAHPIDFGSTCYNTTHQLPSLCYGSRHPCQDDEPDQILTTPSHSSGLLVEPIHQGWNTY